MRGTQVPLNRGQETKSEAADRWPTGMFLCFVLISRTFLFFVRVDLKCFRYTKKYLVIHTHTHIYIFFSRLFSVIGYHKVW